MPIDIYKSMDFTIIKTQLKLIESRNSTDDFSIKIVGDLESEKGLTISFVLNKKKIAHRNLTTLSFGKKYDSDLTPLLKKFKNNQFNDDNTVFIHSLEVLNNYRGMGFGKKMKNFTHQVCKKMGFKYIVGVVDNDNKISLNLHRKMGYIFGPEHNNATLIYKKL